MEFEDRFLFVRDLFVLRELLLYEIFLIAKVRKVFDEFLDVRLRPREEIRKRIH